MGRAMTQLEKYQSKHRIKPNYGFRDIGRVMTCAVDAIRIHPNRLGKGWVHDQDEIKQAAARQNYIERHDL